MRVAGVPAAAAATVGGTYYAQNQYCIPLVPPSHKGSFDDICMIFSAYGMSLLSLLLRPQFVVH